MTVKFPLKWRTLLKIMVRGGVFCSCPLATLRTIGVDIAAKIVALEPLASALGVATFLHNVIIVHSLFSLEAGCFFMHYNTQLCNTAWGKKLLARVTQCTCFCVKNRDSNFFRSVGQECQSKCKTSFSPRTKINVISTTNVIREIKPTKT